MLDNFPLNHFLFQCQRSGIKCKFLLTHAKSFLKNPQFERSNLHHQQRSYLKKQQHLRLKQYKIVWILTSCPLLTVEMNSCELFAHSFHMAHMSLGESYSCHLNKHIFVMLERRLISYCWSDVVLGLHQAIGGIQYSSERFRDQGSPPSLVMSVPGREE